MQSASGLFSRKHHLLHVNRKQGVLPEGKGSSLKNANTTLANNHKQIEPVLVSKTPKGLTEPLVTNRCIYGNKGKKADTHLPGNLPV